MDLESLEVHKDVKSQMGLKAKILEKMPGLTAFMRYKKSIVELAERVVFNISHKTLLYR